MNKIEKEELDIQLKEIYNNSNNQNTDNIIKKYDTLIKNSEVEKMTDYDDICYFYRKLFESVNWFYNLDLVNKMSSKLLRKWNKDVPKNSKHNPYFNPIIDVLILSALAYQRDYPLEAIKYFEKAYKHGEKYLDDSKRDYHDSLCCAITWLGSLYYGMGEYEKSKFYFHRALELYKSVKDLKGFYYKEYSPDVINHYLLSIESIVRS